MDLKGLIADQLGHFSVYDIPEVLFVLVFAALLGYVLARWGAKEGPGEVKRAALWAAAAALAATFVRAQLPLAVLMLAAAVLVGKRQGTEKDGLFFAVLVVGIGCGSGATIVVLFACIPFILLLRWAYGASSR